MKLHILLTVLATATTSVCAQQCYSMDGQTLDARYQPCYPNAGSTGSACCMLNGTQGANQQNDLCLDSGLCQSTSGWYAGFLYINGCTDQTGKGDGCPKICNFSEYDIHIQNFRLTQNRGKSIFMVSLAVRAWQILLPSSIGYNKLLQ